MANRSPSPETVIKHLRSLADLLESGTVELLNADAFVNTQHEVLTMGARRIDEPDNNTYSTLRTIRIEYKQK